MDSKTFIREVRVRVRVRVSVRFRFRFGVRVRVRGKVRVRFRVRVGVGVSDKVWKHLEQTERSTLLRQWCIGPDPEPNPQVWDTMLACTIHTCTCTMHHWSPYTC